MSHDIDIETRLEPRSHTRARLYGRDRDISAVASLLRDPGVRLLTVTGPAGVGKSALVNEVLAGAGHPAETPNAPEAGGASAPHGEVPAGIAAGTAGTVVTVDLASAEDGTQAWHRIASAVGLAAESGHEPSPDRLLESIRSRIGSEETLLVLDNADLATEELPTGLSTLLRGCPGLRVLLTNRASLNVYAERLYPVAPLPVGQRCPETQESLTVQLFRDHIGAHYRSDVLKLSERQHIVEICELLDGLPLAIEVTARAVGAMSTRALLEALRRGEYPHNSQLLDVPQRHQSVPRAVHWGDGALTGEERTLLRRLTVCAGPIDLLTVQRIGQLSRSRAASLLHSLVQKSLLANVGRQDGDPEFRLLNTVRDHYRKQLTWDTDEWTLARDRHADHYAKLAVAAERGLRDAEHRAYWLALAQARMPDVRTAVDWLQSTGSQSAAVRTLAALEDAFTVHGLLPEAAGALARSLSAIEAQEPETPQDASRAADAARTAGRWALLAGVAGEQSRAGALLERAHELYGQAGDSHGTALVSVLEGFLALREGVGESTESAKAAEERVASAVAELETRGDIRAAAEGQRLLALARAARAARDAEEPLHRALDSLRPLNEPYSVALTLIDLARVRLLEGDRRSAYTTVREASELLLLHSGSPRDVVLAVETTARSAPDGDAAAREHLAKMVAAADALRERHRVPQRSPEEAAALRALAPLRPVGSLEPTAPERSADRTGPMSSTGTVDLATAYGESRPTLQSALTTALSAPSPDPASGCESPEDPRLVELTSRQLQIAELVAKGMTNRQIARNLGLSEWTVVNHLRRVMNKLECPSRVHVARIVQRRAA